MYVCSSQNWNIFILLSKMCVCFFAKKRTINNVRQESFKVDRENGLQVHPSSSSGTESWLAITNLQSLKDADAKVIYWFILMFVCRKHLYLNECSNIFEILLSASKRIAIDFDANLLENLVLVSLNLSQNSCNLQNELYDPFVVVVHLLPTLGWQHA